MQALKVARYIINKAIELEKPISNLQLQKIMYFVQLDFLKQVGKGLIDDDFEARSFGPIVGSVYSQYRVFGSSELFMPEKDAQLDLSQNEQSIIDATIRNSLQLKPWELVQKSHNPKGAWAAVFKNGEGARVRIPKKLIEKEAKKWSG
ncbi:hypothetical protein BKH46_08395 [Helicobacter sp. 12S02634-8]|uniref:Panacea domain-containing protein n=1 Tax=Helicobacter sp. 12S02634-8 TaxID=1476199 RepID=UPI000BA7C002|nr:type II toxin-antitoxin system antitoxin SocA domain-containing protein [Helicobacter sp. 12S02634-8]PAF46249.1 hypothetical protein BKH46_08395 [Helicobacter sp. 12S02634-8]